MVKLRKVKLNHLRKRTKLNPNLTTQYLPMMQLNRKMGPRILMKIQKLRKMQLKLVKQKTNLKIILSLMIKRKRRLLNQIRNVSRRRQL